MFTHQYNKLLLLRLGWIIGILLISGMIFASLAEDVVNHESFSTLDPIFGYWLITHTSLTGGRIFSLITFLGNAVVISTGTALLGLWFTKRKRWNQLVFLISAIGGAAFLNLLLKNIFLRPRPTFPQAYLVDTGFSFPSGHAMLSIAFYGMVAYFLLTTLKNRQTKVLVIIGLVMVSTLIGFSRIYLGVHYLTDIFAGWAAGILWLAVCFLGKELIDHRKQIRHYALQLLKLT